MKKLNPLALVLLILTALTGGQGWAQDVDLIEEEGILHEIAFETNEVIINGVEYRVAYDAKVEIRGSYGAFTMLQPGMKLQYQYRRHSDTEREIFDIRQLPDNTALEET